MPNEFDLTAAVNEELTKYSDDILKEVKTIIADEAEKLSADIRERSPKRSKKLKGRTLNAYSKGWTAKKVKEDNLSTEYIVYNKNQYQLTHLLEKGHATRDGGRVEGTPHIAPAEEEAQQRIVERIESAVGGK